MIFCLLALILHKNSTFFVSSLYIFSLSYFTMKPSKLLQQISDARRTIFGRYNILKIFINIGIKILNIFSNNT